MKSTSKLHAVIREKNFLISFHEKHIEFLESENNYLKQEVKRFKELGDILQEWLLQERARK